MEIKKIGTIIAFLLFLFIVPLVSTTPNTKHNLFISFEGITASDKGIDANAFDECPMVLNDSGNTTVKCGLWDCTDWKNGITCSKYEYLGELLSAKVSGTLKLIEDGYIKIYLEDKLILDSSRLQQPPITGLVTKEISEEIENIENIPEENIQENITNITIPEEITVSENATNVTIPENITNVTLPNITQPENTTKPAENTTEPIQDITVREISFSEICIETCDLRLGPNKTSYQLKFEIENAELELDTVTYTILAIEEIQNITNITSEETIQGRAEIGKPVRWIKKAKLNETTTNVSIELPREVENIKAYKIVDEERIDIDTNKIKINEDGILIPVTETSMITGFAIEEEEAEKEIELIIEEELEELEVEYYTEAPQVLEQEISAYKKQITVYSDVHYEGVFTYTTISEITSKTRAIKLYWLVNDTEQLVSEVNYSDTNNNGKIDRIEWITPYLSNQTYIIEIIKAEHLDENRSFISDIYEEVKELDDVWSEIIPSEHYVRVTFELDLTKENDITIYPRTVSGNPRIEVYEFNKTELIAEFTNINSNEYNKVFLDNLEGSQDTFDLLILDGNLEFDHIIDPAEGTPNTTLAFFMSSEGYLGSDGGISNDDFDECPIVLNDYGDTNEKCELWDCLSWETLGASDQAVFCEGGWDCLYWNGVSCETWNCTGWTTAASTKTTYYCDSGFNCISWNGNYCETWDCIDATWTKASDDKGDSYCEGEWDCLSWIDGICETWDCTTWDSAPATEKKDYYCAGVWNCTTWNGDNCDIWDCTSWLADGTAKFDVTCQGEWDCAEWNSNRCATWNCTDMKITGTGAELTEDWFCDQWNCMTWDETKKACETWDCLNWIYYTTADLDYSCVGGFNCSVWKEFAPPDTTPPIVYLETPLNNTVNTTTSTPEFFFNVTDDLQTTLNCTLWIDDDGTIEPYGTNTSVVNFTSSNFTANASLANNDYWWWVNCTDGININKSEVRNISINLPDSTPPTIYLETPLNNTVNTTTSTPEFFFNVTDNNATTLNCTLWIDDDGTIEPYGTNTSVINFTSSNFTANKSLANNDYWWWINCTDGINTNMSEVRNISISILDTTPPIVYLESPANNTLNITTSTPEFFFNVTDDLQTTLNCTLWLENSTEIAPYGTNTTVVNFTSSNFTANASLPDADYWWWVNCTDGTNMNKSEVRNISIVDYPSFANFSVNKTTVGKNQFVQFNLTAADPDSMSYVNGTIEGVMYEFTQNSDWWYFDFDCSVSNKAVDFTYVSGNDTYNKWNESSVSISSVMCDADDPSISNPGLNETSLNQNEYFCVNATVSNPGPAPSDVVLAELWNTTDRYNITLSNATGGCGNAGGDNFSATIKAGKVGIWNYTQVFANDTTGNKQTSDFDDIQLTVLDITPPIVYLETPLNNTINTTTNTPEFFFNATDENATTLNCTLWLENSTTGVVEPYGTNTTVVNFTSSNFTANASLANGDYWWWVNCTDGINMNKSDVRNISINLQDYPSFANFSVNKTTVGKNQFVQFNLTAADPDSMSYVNGTIEGVMYEFTQATGTWWYFDFDCNVSNKAVDFTHVSGNDTLNNWNESSVSVSSVMCDADDPSISNPGLNETSINQNEYFCVNATVSNPGPAPADVVLAELWNTTDRYNITLSNATGGCGDPAGGDIFSAIIKAGKVGTWNYSMVFANDTTGNKQTSDFDDIQLTVLDITLPIVYLETPLNNTINTTTNTPEFFFNVTDENATTLNCTLWLDDDGTIEPYGTNTTIINFTSSNFTTNKSLANNDYWWWINCTDGINMNKSEVRNISINLPDTTPPIVYLETPLNNTINTTTNTPEFFFNVTDDLQTTLDCTLWLENSTEIAPYGTNTTVLNFTSSNFTANASLPDADYWWWINCTDGTNMNKSEVRNISIVDYPSFANFSVNKTTVGKNQFVQFNLTAADPDGMSYVNGTIEGVMYEFTQNSGWWYFDFDCNVSNKAVDFTYVSGNDTYNKWNETSVSGVNVMCDADDPSISNPGLNETSINQNEYFCVNATVSNPGPAPSDVVLAELWNTTDRYNITLSNATGGCGNAGGDNFSATIKAGKVGIWNYTQVFANDTTGNKQTSDFNDIQLTVLDITLPIVYLETPLNNTINTTTNTPEFFFNVTDDLQTTLDCTLWLENSTETAPYGTNTSIVNFTSSNFTANASLADGDYWWWVNCSDGTNTNKSEVRNISIVDYPSFANFSVNKTTVGKNQFVQFNLTATDDDSMSYVNGTIESIMYEFTQNSGWWYFDWDCNVSNKAVDFTYVSGNDTYNKWNESSVSISSVMCDADDPSISNPGLNETSLNQNEYFCVNATVSNPGPAPVDVVLAELWNTTDRYNITLSNATGTCGDPTGGDVFSATIKAGKVGTWNYSMIFANDTTGNKQTSDFDDIQLTVLDITSPIVYLETPLNNTTNTTTNTPEFFFNVTDENATTLNCTLWLDDDGTIEPYGTNTTVVNWTSSNFTANKSLANNDYWWWINCSDGTNTNKSEVRNITINLPDTTPPIVYLETPLNNTINTTTNTPEFFFNVTDDLQTTLNCTLWLENSTETAPYGTNTTVLNFTSSNFTANASLPDDDYWWWINCTDGYDNMNMSEVRNISIVDYPSFANFSVNKTTVGKNKFVQFNLTASDPDSMSYVNGTIESIMYEFTQGSGTWWYFDWDCNVSNKAVDFTYVSGNDTYNKWNESSVSISSVMCDADDPSISNPGLNETPINQNEYFCVNATVSNPGPAPSDVVLAELWNTTDRYNITLSNATGGCGDPAGGDVFSATIKAGKAGTWNYTMVFANDTTGNEQTSDFNDIQLTVLDITPPIVYLETPLNNTINTTTNTPEFFFNVTDENATTLNCTLWLENSTGITPYGTNTSVVNFTSSNFTANKPLTNSDYWWWINCSDGINTNMSEVRNISINLPDSTPPIIYLETPLNNTVNTTTNTPEFFFNVTDENATTLNCTLWLDDLGTPEPYGTNTSIINFTSSNFTANKSLTNSDYWWWINCSDGINTNMSEVRNISINLPDSTPPIIYLETPLNNTINTTTNTPEFFFNVTDNLVTTLDCTLWLENSTGITPYGTNTSVINFTSSNFIVNESLVNEDHWWWINCTDGQDNMNMSEVRNISINFVNQPPNWTSVAKNDTTIYMNDLIEFNTTWDDDQGISGLDSYIFGINQTGSWVNTTPYSFSGTNLSTNISKIIQSPGLKAEWQFYANDTNGAWNQTDVQSFNVMDDYPAFANFSVNKTKAGKKHGKNQFVQFNLTASDENSMSYVNGTIEGIMYEFTQGSGTWWYFDWDCNVSNKAVDFTYVSGNDTLNNWNETSVSGINVMCDANDPSISNPGLNETSINQNEYFCVNATVSNPGPAPSDVVLAELWNTSTRYNITLSNATGGCGNAGGDIFSAIIKTGKVGTWNYSMVFANDTTGNEQTSDFDDTQLTVLDITPPIVYLETPLNNTINTTTNTPEFFFNTTDENATTLDCTLWLENSTTGVVEPYGTNTSVVNFTSSNFTANASLADGDYWWWINCTDGINTNMSEVRNISINIPDTTPPIVYLESPANNTLNTTTRTPEFFFNVTDDLAETLNCTLWLDSGTQEPYGTNTSVVNFTSSNFTANASLADGDYWWWTNCTDGINTNMSEVRNISINIPDTTPPIVYLESPANNTLNTTTNTPEFFFNVTDDLATTLNCTLWLDSGIVAPYGTNSSVLNATSTPITANASLANSDYWWWINCTDGINMNKSEVRNISVDIESDKPYFNNFIANESLIGLNKYARFSADVFDATSDIDYVNGTIEGTTYDFVDSGADEWYYDWQCTSSGTIDFTWIGANDTVGNWNETNISAINVECDASAPSISGETKSPEPSYNNDSVTLNATITDAEGNLDTVWISGNWAGSWENTTVTTYDGDIYYFVVGSGNFSSGDVVGWRYYANDTAGNLQIGTLKSFTVQEGGLPGEEGGVAGGAEPPGPIYAFSLNINLIKVSIKQGESKSEVIKITNTGNNVLNIDIDAAGSIKRFMIISEESFSLKAGETKTINIDFFAKEDEPPEAYIGRITIRGGRVTKLINVIVEIKERKPLFDILTEVINKKVRPRYNVKANITMFNMGDLKPLDISLYYAIKDFEGNILEFRDESLAIYEELGVIREIKIPKNIAVGNYIFYSRVSYENITATSTDTFEVVRINIKKILLITLSIIIFSVILTSIIVFSIIAIVLIELLKKPKKKRKK